MTEVAAAPATAVDGTPTSEMLSTGAGVCIHCVTGFEIPGEPKGRMEKIGPYQTYVASPPEGSPVKDDAAIAFFPDAFGLGLKNNKIIPDMLAAKLGVRVYAVDYFDGKPCSESLAQGMPATAEATRKAGILGKLKAGAKFAGVAGWFYKNRHSLTIPKTAEWLSTLKKEKGITRIGGVGYCYGGKTTLALNGQGLLDASVACHPSLVAKADIEGIKKAVLFLCAEEDPIFPASAQAQAKEIIKKKENVPFNLILYPNTVHGFAARPDLSEPTVKSAFEGAFSQTVTWFSKHIVNPE